MPAREETLPEDPELFDRCLRFAWGLEGDAAERREPLSYGTAYLNPSAPLLSDYSYVLVERTGLSAADIVEEARPLFEQAGLPDFAVGALDPAEAERLAPEMSQLGFDAERSLFMVHRRDPDRPAEAPVAETTEAEIAELRRQAVAEAWAPDYEGPADEVVAQFLERGAALGVVASDRWFVAEHEGRPASCCRLLSRDGAGQVEDVTTLEGVRGHGLARATILAAVAASKAEGNELTLIGAELDDWPWRLYRRLGFDPVGSDLAFVRRSQRR